MIVLSVGMPRSGSVWHYRIIHDLMAAIGCAETSELRAKFRLQNILTRSNCNIGVLSVRRLGMVAVPALMGNTFVIKAHAGPTRTSRLFQRLLLLRITYIYRDPRDAMLSAFDFGQRALTKGRPNAFSYLSDFDKSADFMMEWSRCRWQSGKGSFQGIERSQIPAPTFINRIPGDFDPQVRVSGFCFRSVHLLQTAL